MGKVLDLWQSEDGELEICCLSPSYWNVIYVSTKSYEHTLTCCFPRVDLQHKHRFSVHMWLLCVSVSLIRVLQHHEPGTISCSFSRCLKSPLETLSMTYCQLSRSDLKHLSECQSLYQLKQLHFKSVMFSKSCFKSLRILLENVSGTLQTLQLEHCRMKDYQLKVLLPALSQCCHLTRINFYGNNFSSSVLKDLLQCMANLRKLTVEL